MKTDRSRRRWLPAVLLVVALAAASGCTSLAPANAPPRLIVDARPSEGFAPLSVRFDAGSSTDDGSIIEIEWSFDDGGSVTGWAIERTFPRPGRHEVRVVASDDAGARSAQTVEIIVHNTAPYASCRFSNDAPIVGERVQFDASSSSDPDGTIVDVIWSFGDGATARGTRVSHVYDEIGAYLVELTVVDDHGAANRLVHPFSVHLATGGGGCGGR